MNEVTIRFTEQEGNNILSLFDTACKSSSGGLPAALLAAPLTLKIQTAFTEAAKEPAKSTVPKATQPTE